MIFDAYVFVDGQTHKYECLHVCMSAFVNMYMVLCTHGFMYI